MADKKPLTSAEKKEMRGYAQRLQPHVHVGRQGLTSGVLAEIDLALTRNGLIKIRFECDRATQAAWSTEIVEKSACEQVGQVGRTASFFREMPEAPSGDGG